MLTCAKDIVSESRFDIMFGKYQTLEELGIENG